MLDDFLAQLVDVFWVGLGPDLGDHSAGALDKCWPSRTATCLKVRSSNAQPAMNNVVSIEPPAQFQAGAAQQVRMLGGVPQLFQPGSDCVAIDLGDSSSFRVAQVVERIEGSLRIAGAGQQAGEVAGLGAACWIPSPSSGSSSRAKARQRFNAARRSWTASVSL